MTKPDVSVFLGPGRDARAMNDAVRQLRALPQDQVCDFVWGMVDHDPIMALGVARRLLRGRPSFEELLRYGFTRADASTIRFWVEGCMGPLTAERIVQIYLPFALRNPKRARYFAYHVNGIMGRASPVAIAVIADLNRRLAAIPDDAVDELDVPVSVICGEPTMSLEEAAQRSRELVQRFAIGDGQLAWSSYMLEQAIEEIERAVGGPPEPLLRAAWDLLAEIRLDRVSFYFCESLGNEIIARRMRYAGWDLTWMTNHQTPTQLCLAAATLAVKRELWTEEMEREFRYISRTYWR